MNRLAVALLLTLSAIACAADPPVKEPLMLWDCDSVAGVAGVELVTDNVKQGTGAIRWRHHDQQSSISLPAIPADWTGYTVLRMWVYSHAAVPTSVEIIAVSENPETEGADYYGYGKSLNFTGWQEWIFDIGTPGGARSPRGWDEIDKLWITASGWGNTPHPKADLLLDDIHLEYVPPTVGPRMTDEQFFEALDLTRPELAKVKAAVDQDDLETAKAAFLNHLRERTSPEWWFDYRERPTDVHPVEGGSDGWDYYATRFAVDWTGWKHFTLPLDKFGASRQPIGWHYINYLSFSSTYGDQTPNPQTSLAFDGLQLTAEKPLVLGDFETQEDLDAWDLPATEEHVKVGDRAGLWVPGGKNSITRRDLPKDLTSYQALDFWIWSAAATGDKITVIFDSDTPNYSRADAEMKHVYAGYFVGDDIDWTANKYDRKDPAYTPEWTYNLNRFSMWTDLGKAYWGTGDEKYAKEWIAQLRDWVEDNPYLLTGTGNNTPTWRTIEAGIRTAGSWQDTLQYFLASPSLTGDDLVMFIKSWIEHAHHLMRITVEHPEHGGNWVTMECNGLGHLGVMLPEAKDSALWLKTAVDRMSLELGRQVYPDGAQKELTTGYHQVALINFVGLYRIAHLNGVELPKPYLTALENLYNYNLRAMTPDRHLPPLNDAGYTGVQRYLEEGAELFGRDDFRWAASGGAEGQAVDYTSVAFPYAGQYVMRSGWAPEDRYLLYESGPYGIGHQHEDKLSMFAYGYGRPLLTEAGTYSYDRSKYRRYVLSTWAHNTVLVDGQGQHRNGLPDTYQTDQPVDNLWLHNDIFDAADGRYDSGYGPKRELTSTHERTVVFLRPDYWVVLDRLAGEGQHTYETLWNLNNDTAEQNPQTKAAWGTDANVANLLITPSPAVGLDLDIVVGRDEPPLGFAPASRKKPVPCLDYTRPITGAAEQAWVLTPYPDAKPNVSVKLASQDGGSLVTITRDGGTDYVFIAPRGETAATTVADRKLSGHVAVVRCDAAGKVLAAKAE